MKFIAKLAFCFALCFGLHCQGAILEGRVVGVIDGDTVKVLDSAHVQHRIRLGGIDAPEKRQAFGARAKESLSTMVFDKSVTVQTGKTDRYGREIGKILVNGLDANLHQVTEGLASHDKAYASEQSAEDRQRYDLAEREARAARRGLWLDVDPVPPWDWRKGRRGG